MGYNMHDNPGQYMQMNPGAGGQIGDQQGVPGHMGDPALMGAMGGAGQYGDNGGNGNFGGAQGDDDS